MQGIFHQQPCCEDNEYNYTGITVPACIGAHPRNSGATGRSEGAFASTSLVCARFIFRWGDMGLSPQQSIELVWMCSSFHTSTHRHEHTHTHIMGLFLTTKKYEGWQWKKHKYKQVQYMPLLYSKKKNAIILVMVAMLWKKTWNPCHSKFKRLSVINSWWLPIENNWNAFFKEQKRHSYNVFCLAQ